VPEPPPITPADARRAATEAFVKRMGTAAGCALIGAVVLPGGDSVLWHWLGSLMERSPDAYRPKYNIETLMYKCAPAIAGIVATLGARLASGRSRGGFILTAGIGLFALAEFVDAPGLDPTYRMTVIERAAYFLNRFHWAQDHLRAFVPVVACLSVTMALTRVAYVYAASQLARNGAAVGAVATIASLVIPLDAGHPMSFALINPFIAFCVLVILAACVLAIVNGARGVRSKDLSVYVLWMIPIGVLLLPVMDGLFVSMAPIATLATLCWMLGPFFAVGVGLAALLELGMGGLTPWDPPDDHP
jgi:hypothetical protein